MQWDLGLQGIGYLVAMAACFGVAAGLVVGGGLSRRTWAAVVTTAACFVTGLVTSEVFFGWATGEDLQPNIDGLSRDEVLLSSVLTTVVVVLVMRFLHRHEAPDGRHLTGHRGRHTRHA
jgi:hypothetical protein